MKDANGGDARKTRLPAEIEALGDETRNALALQASRILQCPDVLYQGEASNADDLRAILWKIARDYGGSPATLAELQAMKAEIVGELKATQGTASALHAARPRIAGATYAQAAGGAITEGDRRNLSRGSTPLPHSNAKSPGDHYQNQQCGGSDRNQKWKARWQCTSAPKG